MEPQKEGWSGYYTLVLIMNVIYIVLFFILMNFYSA